MANSNYIGSKLSLISKSNIRYVGTLQNVDTQTSSIALGQVLSFGTEGRRGGRFQDEIPPSDTVFEYIVFNGADVKDLQVFEAPPPARAPQPYALPQNGTSNVYFHSYSMPTAYYAYPMINQHYAMYPPQPSETPFPPPLPTAMFTITQKPEATDDVTPNTIFSPTAFVPDTMTKVRTPLVDGNDADNSHLTISKPDTKDSPSPSPQTTPDTLVTSFDTDLDGVTRIIDDLDIGHKGRSSTDEKTAESDLKSNKNINLMTANKKPNKNTSSGNRNVKSKLKRTNTAKLPTLQPEFDFASSNAKFNKDTNQLANPSEDTFYDKKKSFFDNISCDAKEKTERSTITRDYRKKHQNEKQLNLETFGPSSILPRRKQARQGGRTNSIRRNNGKQATTL